VPIEQAATEADFVVRDPMPNFEFHHLGTSVGSIEFERAIESVRRFLVVVDHEVTCAPQILCSVAHTGSRRQFESVLMMKAAEDRPHGDAMADRQAMEIKLLRNPYR
jgi:hypothetical protein